MKPEKFASFDKTVLQCYLWNDVKNPKGVVQISHGMAEHARRYDAFAQFLNANGYIVFADDHRAHGMTSTKQSKKGIYGYHKGDIYNDTVRDEIAITAHLKERFGVPVVYLGHSYGSMLGQRYIEMDNDSCGAILCGSACMKGALLGVGCAVANVQYAILGGEKEGKLLNALSFGSYNAKFKKDKTDYAWLSRDKEQVRKYIFDEQCGGVMSIAFFKFFFEPRGHRQGQAHRHIQRRAGSRRRRGQAGGQALQAVHLSGRQGRHPQALFRCSTRDPQRDQPRGSVC